MSASATSGSSGDIRRVSIHEKEKDSGDKRGGTPEPTRRRDTRSGSMNSQSSRAGLEESLSATDPKKHDALATLTQNFCPVTLTLNVFFKQVLNYLINCGGIWDGPILLLLGRSLGRAIIIVIGEEFRKGHYYCYWGGVWDGPLLLLLGRSLGCAIIIVIGEEFGMCHYYCYWEEFGMGHYYCYWGGV